MNACAHCAAPIPQGTLCPECVEAWKEEYRMNVPADDMAPVEEPEAQAEEQRRESIEVSERVIIGCCLIAFAVVGLAIGAALANLTAPLP